MHTNGPLDECLDRLATASAWGYSATGSAASEPTALAAIALLAAGRVAPAQRALDWLAAAQQSNGAVGVFADHATPAWPTSLAALAFRTAEHDTERYRRPRARAVDWLLATKGSPVKKEEKLSHDMSLIGWPWVESTHSWVEPTALALLALRAVGHAAHPRAQEAIKILVDRLLPDGGCNYGNTFVLGQKLLPHVQPTALAMLALAGLELADPRIARSLDYLARSVDGRTATASLSYGVLALTAHGHRPAQADRWLTAAANRVLARDASAHKLAVIALAFSGDVMAIGAVNPEGTTGNSQGRKPLD
ncbi:MAG: hypothetical protein WD176_10195, partial [Pirellulales bacterium]